MKPTPGRRHRGPVRTAAILARFTVEERELIARAAASESRVAAQFVRLASLQHAVLVLGVDRRPGRPRA